MSDTSSLSSVEAPAFSLPSTSPTSSSTHSMAAKIRALSQRSRPQIKISLNGCEDAWVAEYSTMDKIEGKVSITCPTRTPVESLSIDFVGSSRAFVERISSSTAVSGRSEAHHQFLKLTQPISPSAWPENQVFEANQTYDFNFLFVVPQQLLPRVCRHSVSGSIVQQEHLKLPPSFGDKSVAGRGKQLMDDLAPEMSRIRYCIGVALREVSKYDTPLEPVVKTKKVRIMPRVEEQPPVDTEGPLNDYVLRQEKDVRKGLFKGKLGRLVVESTQPKAIRIQSGASDERTDETTMTTVNVRFDPADGKGAPPKLGSITTRLKVATFFSSSARTKLPARGDTQWDFTQGLHSESISLAQRCLGNIEWDWNSADADSSRRCSTVSSMSGDVMVVPEASKKYKGEGYWTAQIVVPVSLPTNKAWIPTFHSCLISRSYGLSVHLGLNTGGLGSGMDLKLPLQLATEPTAAQEDADRQHSLSLEERAVEALEADDFFAPRTISPIDARFAGRSSIRSSQGQQTPGVGSDLPPSYEAFPTTRNLAVTA